MPVPQMCQLNEQSSDPFFSPPKSPSVPTCEDPAPPSYGSLYVPSSKGPADSGTQEACRRLFGHWAEDSAAPPAAPQLSGHATTKTGVNVRATASSHGRILGKLAAGTTVDVYAAFGSWLKVGYEGRKAFITRGKDHVEYAKITEVPSQDETPSEQGETPAPSPPGSPPPGESGGGSDSKGPDTDEQGPTDTLGQMSAPAYFSQRDNLFKGAIGFKDGVKPDAECNVTSLAMQLVTLAGGSQPVNRRTAELLAQHGVTVKAEDIEQAQPEDLILRLFQALGDEYWEKVSTDKQTRGAFWKGFYEQWQGGDKGWHQIPNCLLFIGRQYVDFVGGGKRASKETEATTSPEYFQTKLKPELAAGGAVMLSTDLSGQGHIVLLVGVEEDGVRINDPYGMNAGSQSKYVRNNIKPEHPKYFEDFAAQIATRLKFNPDLQSIVADEGHRAERVLANWGENNFFTWNEVTALNIGKWNTVLMKKT